jgi:hypothetical protein
MSFGEIKIKGFKSKSTKRRIGGHIEICLLYPSYTKNDHGFFSNTIDLFNFEFLV